MAMVREDAILERRSWIECTELGDGSDRGKTRGLARDANLAALSF